MLRICKYCGTTYDGDPGGSCCPDCAAAQRETTLRERTCTECGAKFLGGPSARYCRACREARRRKAEREYRQRRAAGQVRSIGSTSICEICDGPYTVTGGLQRYCSACAPEAIRTKDNAKSREWAAAHRDTDSRRAERHAATAPLLCAVCGKPYIPTSSALTCSPECSTLLQAKRAAAWEKEHKAERNRYRRLKYAEKAGAMTPEEYRELRDRVNAKARENYARRNAENAKKGLETVTPGD